MIQLTIPAQYRRPPNIYAERGELQNFPLIKPRLRKVRGMWMCAMPYEDFSLKACVCETPEQAYALWHWMRYERK